ncbi:MAG: hypothetical protein IPJ65_31700 [Archangiaceae bacterium]|nr:hypothetical protein [Archangiaceae bacterium]
MRRVLLCAVLLVPALALAKAKVVLDAPKPIAALLEKALKAKYSVSKTSLSPEPTGGDVKAACREAGGAIAVVTARQGGDLYTVMVLNGADGSPLSSFRVKFGKKPPKVLAKPDLRKLLDGLDDAKAPKREEAVKPPPPVEEKPVEVAEKPRPAEEKKPEPVEEKPRREEKRVRSEPPPPREELREKEEPSDRDGAKKPTALRFGAGIKVFNRRFGYTDDIFDALSTYYLPGGPAIALELDVFPAAFVTNGFAANVGVLGQFDYAVGIASRAADGTRYGTTAFNVRAALAVRLPVSILTVTPFFGFSRQAYSIAASNGAKPNIPSVGYTALRPGILLKLALFGPVGFQAHFAGDLLLAKGEIASYFPRASANGLDTGGAFTVTLLDRLELKLGGEYQRYWYSMNPMVGDMNVAGGALDVYVSGNFTVSFML